MVEESGEVKSEARTIDVAKNDENSLVEDPDRKQVNSTQTLDRETLISTAVHFLQNSRVKNVSLNQKRAFLLRKGLTNEDIDLAIDRVTMGEKSVPLSNNQVSGQSNNVVPYQQAGPIMVYQPPPTSLWYRWREFCSSLMVIGATFYGCYFVFKRFIEPLLLGKTKQEEDRMSKIERHLNELNKSLTQLRHSLVCVESTLCKQKSGIEDFTLDCDATVVAQDVLSDIKGDISTIKSLLLSRNQFPAAPTITIPTWQLKQREEEKKEAQKQNETEEEDENINIQSENLENEETTKEAQKSSDEEYEKLPNGININGTDH